MTSLTVLVSAQATLTGAVTFTDNGISLGAGQNTLTYNAWQVLASLSPTSVPVVTQYSADLYTVSSGSATIDLETVTLPGGSAGSYAGMAVVGAMFSAPPTNANPITVTVTGSNGYAFAGDTAWRETIAPGDTVLKLSLGATGSNNPSVGSAERYLTITGTGSSDQLQVSLCGG